MKSLIFVSVATLLVASCSVSEVESVKDEALPAVTAQAGSFEVNTPELEVIREPVTFTLMNAGDFLTGPEVRNLITTNGYTDFSAVLNGAQAAVDSSDLAFCHLEILSSKSGPTYSYDYAPIFSNPYDTLQQMKDAGWDGCSAASNHSIDAGFQGILDTIQSSQETGMYLTGINDSEENQKPLLVTLEKDGESLTIGFVSYTWSTNLRALPSGKAWSVNTFSRFNLATLDPLIADAQEARDQGADVIVASVHCCQEFVTTPDASQIAISEYLANSGQVDVLIGHHPHVPQTISLINGGPENKGMWVAYSLGNYTAKMSQEWSDIGILSFTDFIVARDTREITIDMRYTTITTDFSGGIHTVLGGDNNSIASIMGDTPAEYVSFANKS